MVIVQLIILYLPMLSESQPSDFDKVMCNSETSLHG